MAAAEAAAAAAGALREAAEEEQLKAELAARAAADCNSTFSGMDEPKTASLEDTIEISDIYRSNAEYFRKLEELKAAHMATMAKLEKLHTNKLNLKGAQPAIIREETPPPTASSVSASVKNSDPSASLVPSLLETDVGCSSLASPVSSEDDLVNLQRETPDKSKVMTFAKELISNMWNGFSVEDYIQSDDTAISSVEKIRKKPKEWVPKITVPEPFQMTVREQKKRDANLKSKAEIEMENKLLKKQEEEEAECRKKFRANPVPESVFLPLYRELVKQNEARRKAMKEKNKEALLASQKPFKFIAREEQKQATREKLKDFFKPTKKTSRFKARPVPQSLYDPTVSDRFKEEELLRKIQAQKKAQELLEDTWPRPAYRSLATKKPRRPERCKCKCKVRCQAPDIENVPKQHKYLSENKCSGSVAPQNSLVLRKCSHSLSRRDKILADIKADEENVNDTDGSLLSPRGKSAGKSTSSKSVLRSCTPPKSTVSSREREEAIRRSLEEKKMLEEERNRILTQQKQRMKELQKLLTARAKAYDSHESLAQMSKSKLKSLRKSNKERMKEYRQELEDREEKLKKRPLLFERVAQKNARMAAEKHYSNTLKALGICDEFVLKKGRSGKILENLSKQERKDFTEDKESFNEEKVEETENEEENDILDTSSQDSCKEKDELSEGNAEEKTVHEEH
ncbi:PREDICTED: protein FAM161A [Elephantulus edwardii]|uniref:protein FAM161A n=1 Tax=Elephantulus edwardii TaxID=28737 RepID=UPI0003F058B9|nr:PREDICTED: protein FAM161A [Elephantulus edwardii]